MKILNPTVFLKDGELYCLTVEVPNEPKQRINCAGTHACTCASLAFENGANRDVVDGYDDNCPHRYTKALASAKASAVKVKNAYENQVEKIVYGKFGSVDGLPENYYAWRERSEKNGTLYTLTGYEAKVKNEPIPCPDNMEGCEVLHLLALATISPISKDSGEWNASPKRKIPLAERLERISQKLRNKHSTTVEEMDLHEAFKFGQNSPIKQEESQEEIQLIAKAKDRLKTADVEMMRYNPNWSVDEPYRRILNLMSTAYQCLSELEKLTIQRKVK